MPGPPRIPPETLRQRGSRLAPERERDQVHGIVGAPAPPDWLTKLDRKVWDRMVALLLPMRVLCESDGPALGRYCKLWVQWQECQRYIEKHGLTYEVKDSDGCVKCIYKRPQVALATQLADQLLKLEQQFGLTPSARTRLKATPKRRNDGKPFKFRIAGR